MHHYLRQHTFLLLFIFLFFNSSCKDDNQPVENMGIELPDGFKIEEYAQVPNARGMCHGPDGVVFVGSRGEGKVFAVVDNNGDHKADQVHTLAEGFDSPVGVAYLDGDLYFTAVGDLMKLEDIANNLNNPPAPVLVTDALPNDASHGWKYLAVGPDNKLYVPVGFPCNICQPEDTVYGTILRYDVIANTWDTIAYGIRNTVGYDWHPTTGELWFTDNGRDWFGDDLPPDELNRLASEGQHFGYPYCHGGQYQDDEYDQRPCSDFVPPVQNLGPHVAALGMRFYTGDMFPAKYHNQVFIAEHGSWNRSTKIGYRIMLVTLNGNEATSYETFASGWEQDGEVSGRPVDVLIMPDGSMLVSDDYAGKVYRISYEG